MVGRVRKSLLFVGALLGAATAHAVPVIPGGVGFGMSTPAGRGGTVYRVTNVNASGAGSLKACIDATGPRTCIFEVSGVIRTNKDLIIRNPNITIAGQTAPSPGVTVLGAGLWVAASEVLVQHMRFRAGDDPAGPDPGNRGALKVVSDGALLQNVVIDHCSLSWGLDETEFHGVLSIALTEKKPLFLISTGSPFAEWIETNGRRY